MAYKLPNPERARTERNRELKRLRKDDEPDRVPRAAALAVAFHEERDINHVMELAQMVRSLADDGVATLMAAYLDQVEAIEDQFERLAMLANVGRWINDEVLESTARETGVDVAVKWCAPIADEIEQAERLGIVERRFDADLRKAVQTHLA